MQFEEREILAGTTVYGDDGKPVAVTTAPVRYLSLTVEVPALKELDEDNAPCAAPKP